MWFRTGGITLGVFLALMLIIPHQAFALNPSEITWQLIVISSEPACTIYHFQMIEKFSEITQKYLDLYQLENSSYEPACMTVEKYHSEYEKPRGLDLVVLVYDSDLGETSLHKYNTGGIYLHQGDDLSTNHSVIICDCPNFYYSDPVWILSHELSHFVLNYLGYDLDLVESEIHALDEKYDHCVEVSYDDSCSEIKTKIIGYRYNWTVMAPYEPAIGEKFSVKTEDVSLNSPYQRSMINELTKWWISEQISTDNYVKSLQILSGSIERDDLNSVGILAESPVVFLAEPSTFSKTIESEEQFSEELKEDILKASPFMKENTTEMSNEEYEIFLEWLKTKAESWDSGDIKDKEFYHELEFLLNSKKPFLYTNFLESLSTDELISKAIEYEENGQYRNAISFYDRVILEGIDSGETPILAFEGKAFSLKSLGMYRQALFYYDSALEIEPENHMILKDKAFTLAQLGDLDEAKFYYELANEIKNN